MRRWIGPVLLITLGLIFGLVGYLLMVKAADFPGPARTVQATVVNDRAASCKAEAPQVRVRFNWQNEARVEVLNEQGDCVPKRTMGETIRVHVLADWPKYVGSCRRCLPVDADEAPEIYSFELGGFAGVGIGILALLGGLGAAASVAVRGRRSRQQPN